MWKRAQAFRLSGWVNNHSSGVTIEIQGSQADVDRFVATFRDDLPPLAIIDRFQIVDLPAQNGQFLFTILESDERAGQSTPVSPDIATCPACLAEMWNPGDRRYRYPFINCTDCGPRFTIVEDIPYDRPLTTMKSFPMCERCQQEYDDPAQRRFHAQPNACPDCGPRIWFVAGNPGEEFFVTCPDDPVLTDDSAIRLFQQAIRDDQIVAVKGIGGFHLACDATSDRAVQTLRNRKGRVDKPFAVMARDIGQCETYCRVGPRERAVLESPQRPIVLLQKRVLADGGTPGLSDRVAPGNRQAGVLLPYSPLHHLLLENMPPLVMTSANTSDEPIVRDNLEAQLRLVRLADGFLLHDREIHIVCDDSVVRCRDDQLLPIRRSRGFAPMPVRLSETGPDVLAVGGEIKATFCVTKNDYAYVSQHIGDMGNLETLDAMHGAVDHFLRLFRVHPAAIAADLHPGYLSSRWARRLADSLNVPLIPVQHHYAHIASLIAETGWPEDCPVIGCCFDGTGFGSDGAIWGGEFLIADGSQYQRIAHLRYIPLPGGDASIRQPCRVALAHLFAAEHPWHRHLPCVQGHRPAKLKLWRQQLEKQINCVPTSSMGRLFDAVAALLGIRQEVNYEAQAAMEMEALAAAALEQGTGGHQCLPFALRQTETELIEIDAGPLIDQLARDVLAGADPRRLAAGFHQAVANLIGDVCEMTRRQRGIGAVGLSGGVFQNGLLCGLTRRALAERGFEVFSHGQVPPNDGGLALGQALVARNRLTGPDPPAATPP